MMRTFDESQLIVSLKRLPAQLRVAFAAACAERLMPAYRLFSTPDERFVSNEVEHSLEQVWADPRPAKNAAELERQIEAVTALIPQEDSVQGPWTQEATNAQNAGMAVIYALRAKLTGEAQEAAWAARVAYEALDNFVINKDRIDTNKPGEEPRVLLHSLVQAELNRQERDVRELLAASDRDVAMMVNQLRDRARAEAVVFFGD